MVLVIEQQGLNGTDDDLGPPPVVTLLLIDDRLKVRGQQSRENLSGLLLQFQAVHQKQHAPSVGRAQKQLDDRCGGERLAGAGRHLEQKAVFAAVYRALQGVYGFKLIGPQKRSLLA